MLEIIGMSIEDAKAIEYCGANRIELVSALTEGGLTPSFSMIEKVVNSVDIPVNVMIRNHAKSFIYSEHDLEVMQKDIELVKSLGANGIVIGVLGDDRKIDEVGLEKLLESVSNIDVTFHKAIDETNVLESVEKLNKYNKITNILTAGGTKNILENINNIKYMIEKSKFNILLGGGLNFDNILEIRELTKTTDFHFGTAVRVDKSPFGEIDTKKLSQLVKLLEV